MTEPATAPVPAKGLFARAIGVITSPKATFEEIAQAPRSFLAMLLVAAASGSVLGGFLSTAVGKAAFLEAATKNSSNPEAAAKGMEVILPYAWALWGFGAFIWVPILTVIMSAILFVVFNALMGGTATFRQIMAIVAHSQFVSVLTTVFTFTLNYVRGTMTSATNLGIFVPMLEEKSFLAIFLGAIDIFLLWWLTWLAIGLAALYRRKTGGVATTFYVLYVLIALVVAYFRSR
jgi:hypothetical protein